MVRVKAAPERALVGGRRITMRETTREVIHEVSMGQHFDHQQNVSRSNDFGEPGQDEYMSDEENHAVLPPKQRQYGHQQVGSRSINYGGPGRDEYMADDEDFARPGENRKNDASVNWDHRMPLKRQQVNEYMTEQYNSSKMESPRVSTLQSPIVMRNEVLRDRHGLHSRVQMENILGHSRNVDRVSAGLLSNGNHSGHDVDAVPLQRRGSIRSGALLTLFYLIMRNSFFGGVPRYGNRSSTGTRARRFRYRAGARALQEIKRYQSSTKLLVPKRPLQRVIREVVTDLYPDLEYRFTADALDAVHEACEAFLVRVLNDGSTCALHARSCR
ncbi:centromeric DNA-binding histone H3-like protein cse4, variant 2 [Parelaphostrongylus tenuis]|uniref:Centromeric DNA-binding histone H3-like protein cse4, variant 2 n=1 Tax=Parelaphostrongylus tenuis TaxID=148309 RepID=A0AAD5WDE7_PARTN|nr:centromeric DNA-binding histone H3-like protein cse4, variant 2 [Parelaphostrongylus tenuis]